MVLVWIILAEGVGYHLHIIFQGFFRHMYRYFVSEDSEKGEMKKGGQKLEPENGGASRESYPLYDNTGMDILSTMNIQFSFDLAN